MIKLPFNVTKASADTTIKLMVIGALQVGRDGLCANEPGIYPKQEEIPTQTANPSGDE